MRRLRSRARGMTLIELMVGLAVMAVLATAAAPFLGDMVANSRLREAGNLLFGETLLPLDMTVPATPAVLRARTLPGAVQAPAKTFDFGPEGRPAPFGTAVSVNLAAAGATCSDDLRCPGLRVDAGGAVRLCGNYQVSCP